MADPSKLGRRGFAQICAVGDDVQWVVTDHGAPADEVSALRRAGVEVVVT